MRKPLLRLVMILLIVAISIATGWYVMTTPGLRPVVISVYEAAMIVPDKRVHDLGVVETDSKISHTFLLYNKGGQHLRITGADASCGCTVADISNKVVAPGDFSRMTVTMDTSIKLGKTRKEITVRSNDPKNPELTLFLVGTVIHKMDTVHTMDVDLEAADPLVLFKGECATCHVDKGRGKTGKALFIADCAMCHGMNAQGVKNVAPSLLDGDYSNDEFLAATRRVIAEGSPNSPQMPPFSQKQGGPLNEGEIDSLVTFLKFQAMQAKLGLLDTEDDQDAVNLQDFEEALRESGLQPEKYL